LNVDELLARCASRAVPLAEEGSQA
jgi:hypothetical protein